MPRKPQRRAVFRLEFGGPRGLGHLARCSALAAEIRGRGWRCVLWSRSDPAGAPPDMLLVFHERLAADGGIPDGVSSADWLVVDDYDFDDEALVDLRAKVGPGGVTHLLVVDDECRRQLGVADLVVNMRLGLERSPYARGGPTLLGEKFALLRPGILDAEEVPAPFPAELEGVLVIMGGSDVGGFTAQALEALAELDPIRFAPVVVRSHESAGAARVRAALGCFANSVWLESLSASALAGWAKQCRWAISAAGGTLFELAALQLPFVAVIVAENQRQLALEVNRRWQFPIVNGGGEIRQDIKAAFTGLVAAGERGSFGGIDGYGAARVADAMANVFGR